MIWTPSSFVGEPQQVLLLYISFTLPHVVAPLEEALEEEEDLLDGGGEGADAASPANARQEIKRKRIIGLQNSQERSLKVIGK